MPAAHAVHASGLLEPRGELWPTSHTPRQLVWPPWISYLPAAQEMHDELATCRYWPGTHASYSQNDALASGTVPAAQVVHEYVPLVLKPPALT